FHLGAAGATNTQGKGGPVWTSRGVIPVDAGNRYMFSIEAGNNGVGEPWPKAQTDAYVLLCCAVLDCVNCETPGAKLGAGDIFAHFEWAPTRKIDPAGPSPWATGAAKWNMDAFRGAVFLRMLDGVGGRPAPIPRADKYNPAKGFYGNMPIRPDKPRLAYGRCKSPYQKVSVRYLKNVLRREDAGSSYSRKLPDDKAFGPSTKAAVLNFQARAGLVTDGIVGPQTWGAIDALAK